MKWDTVSTSAPRNERPNRRKKKRQKLSLHKFVSCGENRYKYEICTKWQSAIYVGTWSKALSTYTKTHTGAHDGGRRTETIRFSFWAVEHRMNLHIRTRRRRRRSHQFRHQNSGKYEILIRLVTNGPSDEFVCSRSTFHASYPAADKWMTIYFMHDGENVNLSLDWINFSLSLQPKPSLSHTFLFARFFFCGESKLRQTQLERHFGISRIHLQLHSIVCK